MFPPPVFNPFDSNQENGKFARETKAVRIAHLRYNDIKRKSWLRQKFASLIGRPKRLKKLSQIQEKQSFVNYYPLGIQSVKVDNIIGSENRADDFDDEFLPINNHNADRWIKIAELMLLNVTLPAVELIKVNDQFYVRDGHHRISVAKNFGQKHIDANVFELVVASLDFKPQPTEAEEALVMQAQACSTS
jgi:hypothetical protein